MRNFQPCGSLRRSPSEFELVDREVRRLLVRVGDHDPGPAFGIVEEIDLRSFLEAFHGGSRFELHPIGRGDGLRRRRNASRLAVSHPFRVETAETPDRADPVGDPVDRPIIGRTDARRKRLVLPGDLLRVQSQGERGRRRVARLVAAVETRRIVDADVENLLQRILAEKIDLRVAIIAQIVKSPVLRAGAIVRQCAEIFAPFRMGGRNALDGQKPESQRRAAQRKTAAAFSDRRHIVLQFSPPILSDVLRPWRVVLNASLLQLGFSGSGSPP